MAQESNGGNSGWMSAAATGIAGGLTGLFQSAGLKRRYKYAKKMAMFEHGLQKEMNQFNAGLALQQWKDTNAPAQVEMLRKAGLSTGLMYGQGGVGGTANTSTGAGPSGGKMNLPGEEGFRFMGIETGLQLAAQQAQIALTKAQAKNIEKDTELKGATQTQTETTIERIKAETENIKLKTEIDSFQKSMAEIESRIKSQTESQTIGSIKAASEKLIAEARSAEIQRDTDEATRTEKIQAIIQATQETAAKILLMQKDITKTDAETKEVASKISKIATEIDTMINQQNLGWENLAVDQKEAMIKQKLQEFQTSDPQQISQWTNIILQLIGIGIRRGK